MASPGSGTPTGTVTFKQGGTTLCTVTLTNGTGYLHPDGHRPGRLRPAYTVVATYVPGSDSNFTAPANQTVNLTVTKAPPRPPPSPVPGQRHLRQ